MNKIEEQLIQEFENGTPPYNVLEAGVNRSRVELVLDEDEPNERVIRNRVELALEQNHDIIGLNIGAEQNETGDQSTKVSFYCH